MPLMFYIEVKKPKVKTIFIKKTCSKEEKGGEGAGGCQPELAEPVKQFLALQQDQSGTKEYVHQLGINENIIFSLSM